MKINKLKLFGALVAGTVLALTACGVSVPEPEQTLEERVMARWEHMIDRDFEAAWEYYSPGFRQTTPVETFVRDMERRRFRWLEADFRGVECAEEDICRAEVRIVYQALGAPSGMSRMRVPHVTREHWLFLEGQWWFSER